MASVGGVRGHTRTTSTGKTVRVQSHRRKTKGPSSRGAQRKAKRAFALSRRGKKGAALKFAGIALAEGLAWGMLQGVTLLITTTILVFVGTLVVVLGGSPKRRRRASRRRTVRRMSGGAK